jgi:hypothetical protein
MMFEDVFLICLENFQTVAILFLLFLLLMSGVSIELNYDLGLFDNASWIIAFKGASTFPFLKSLSLEMFAYWDTRRVWVKVSSGR